MGDDQAECYEPELGQMCFGTQDFGDFGVSNLGVAAVEHVLSELDRVWWNLHQGERDHGQGCEVGGLAYWPYYWGECTCGFDDEDDEWNDENQHAITCYLREYQDHRPKECYGKGREIDEALRRSLCEKHGIPWNGGYGSAVHCTCGHDERYMEWRGTHNHAADCPVVVPNLKLAGTDVEIRWYKHPGRGMSTNRAMTADDWHRWLNACVEALRAVEKEGDRE